MLVQETYIDPEHGYSLGETDPYPPYTDDIGKLFRNYQREYGACTSRVYIDGTDPARPTPVGWVFTKRTDYDDMVHGRSSDCPTTGYHREHHTYIREVWVTLFDAPDDVTRIHHYHAIA